MFTINQNLIDDFADKINEKEKKNNKVTSLSSSSTHVQYPSAKAVYDAISEVEASSGGNYIYDFYHDSSTDDIVLEYDSASDGSGGSGGNGGSCVTDFYIDSNTDEWVIETSACSQGEVVTQWEQTLSDEKVPSEKLVKNTIDGFVQYELSSSDYNPTIDSTITITCTCKNVLGNPIANKTLELMMNGVSQGTSTTNANGIATWTITVGDWENKHFHIGNATLDIKANGWKEVFRNTTTNPKIQVFRNDTHCRLKFSAYTVSSMNTTWTQYGATAFLNDWKPSQAVTFIGYDYTFLLQVGDDGKLRWRTVSGSLTNKNLYGQYEWSIA